jgi:hypothetical protein
MERLLIPDETIISDLLEGLRVERASYSLFGGDDLIGFFFVKGDVNLIVDGR